MHNIASHRHRISRALCACCALVFMLWTLVPVAAYASAAPVDDTGAQLQAVDLPAASEDAAATIAENGDAGLLDGAAFGIENLTRYNKGTNRAIDGAYYGYRWPMVAKDAFCAIATTQGLLVYIPKAQLETVGGTLSDSVFDDVFLATLAATDAASADGGQLFANACDSAYFTSSPTVTWGDYTYAFARELEEGRWYATATLAGSEDGAGGGIYALSGTLANANSIEIATAPTGLAWLSRFFATLDLSPLWVSLRTTIVATLIIFVLGLLAAWGTVKTSDRVKGVLDTVFTIPMVLPPTVCGFLLLLLFGKATAVGRWFIAHGLDLVFTWPAAVIACVVVGFPLMYRTARGAFENLEPAMLDAARTLGWSETRIFRTLMMPLAWPSIAAGTVLAFARAMGEFGATLFFAGNFVGITQTIPLAIYFDWMGGKTETAIFWVIVVILFSFLVILFINIYSSRVQSFRATGGRRKRDDDAADLALESAEFAIDSDAARRLGFGGNASGRGLSRQERVRS